MSVQFEPVPGPGKSWPRRRFLAQAGGLWALGASGLAACSSTAGRGARQNSRLEGPKAPEPSEAWLAELTDQKASVQPISPAQRGERRMRAGRLLVELGLDAFVCEGGANMTYLTGVNWGHSERPFLLVLLADGSHFWLCPAFEAAKAQLSLARAGLASSLAQAVVTWDEHEYAYGPLASALHERRLQRLGFDPASRLFLKENLAARNRALELSSAGEFVRRLRSVKEPAEIALLRRANELTQQALAAVATQVRVGQTGDQIAELAHQAQRRLGLERTWVLALIGPAAAYPHGEDQARGLERDQFLLIDTGGSLHGYQSDQTRTWIGQGAAGVFESRVWNAVQDAQKRAFESIRPGMACKTIDEVARASIQAAGFGAQYAALTHRLGHGIGLEGHEDPYFDGGSEELLQPGMTLSDEPGIYLIDRLGVRLEDIVVVTKQGADHFGAWQPSALSVS